MGVSKFNRNRDRKGSCSSLKELIKINNDSPSSELNDGTIMPLPRYYKQEFTEPDERSEGLSKIISLNPAASATFFIKPRASHSREF